MKPIYKNSIVKILAEIEQGDNNKAIMSLLEVMNLISQDISASRDIFLQELILMPPKTIPDIKDIFKISDKDIRVAPIKIRTLCHEMEASALFIVAKLRKVKIASAFVVSDLLGEETWDPQYNKKHVAEKLNKLVDAAVECLKEIKLK